ncbi:hypothetical protein [Phycicoccus flavus]|uniref:hypothetical protein n=1 Tax=Phycicoccus flavus TaxID=2502783 RepID=UPI000FEBA948|nr:hypothetical protein [Phycicoccus flavus]NHA68234.1 hypothetical protein [Phycicoccus flavus]
MGDPGGGGGGSGGGSGGAGRSTTPARTCTYTLGGKKQTVPCSGKAGWWSQSEQAYCKAASPQPPAGDPAWGGHTDGQIYECTRSVDPRLVGVVYLVWLAQPPNGAPPDPRVLAQQAVATMNLRAVTIGIVPEASPGAVGVVGMPVWMWNADDGASTRGPMTKTAAAGGYAVSATARVTKVVWAMGDGEVVVCRAPGTPYADRFGSQASPDCGYRYDRQGRYTVRATSYWSVDWAGVGQSGSIPLQFSDTAVITVGEVQVLTQ